jgi:hypothetical protein
MNHLCQGDDVGMKEVSVRYCVAFVWYLDSIIRELVWLFHGVLGESYGCRKVEDGVWKNFGIIWNPGIWNPGIWNAGCVIMDKCNNQDSLKIL